MLTTTTTTSPSSHHFITSPTSTLPLTLSPQLANPVLVIHQNNSTSSNISFNHLNHQSNNLIIDDLNLTSNNTLLQINTNNNNNKNNSSSSSSGSDHIDPMTEIKYMKGYVNVLKERFTRKSLGNNISISSGGNDATIDGVNTPPQQHNSPSGKLNNSTTISSQALRLTNGDYQRRKHMQNTTNTIYRNGNISIPIQVEDKKRRSASSYYNGVTNGNSGQVKNSINIVNNNKNNNNNNSNESKKLFASNDDLTQSKANSKSNNRHSLNAHIAINTTASSSNNNNNANTANSSMNSFYIRKFMKDFLNEKNFFLKLDLNRELFFYSLR